MLAGCVVCAAQPNRLHWILDLIGWGGITLSRHSAIFTEIPQGKISIDHHVTCIGCTGCKFTLFSRTKSLCHGGAVFSCHSTSAALPGTLLLASVLTRVTQHNLISFLERSVESPFTFHRTELFTYVVIDSAWKGMQYLLTYLPLDMFKLFKSLSSCG